MHGKVGLVKLGAVSTIRVAFPTILAAVQDMVAVPGATAVANPVDALMVATPVLLLAQPLVVHAGVLLLPDWLLACAVNCTVDPTGAPIVNGVTVIDVTAKTKMLVPSGPTMITCCPVIGVWAQATPKSNTIRISRFILVTNVKGHLY